VSRKFMVKSHESGRSAQLKGLKRRFTTIATVGIAASLVLAGCSSGSDDASSDGDNPLTGSTATNMQGKSLTLGKLCFLPFKPMPRRTTVTMST
jgi:hypothetical protein